ncbi:MAG: FtsX-like permease family protein [Bacteroidota bacterium]
MHKQQPPHWAQRFLRWYCHPLFLEDLEGDLAELYEDRLQYASPRKARWLYVWDVLLLLRPAIVRPIMLPFGQQPAILRSYLTIGFRMLLKYRSYALLNIFGLAVGIAATILLLLIVQYEKSFDTFHVNYDHIYQLREKVTTDDYSKETDHTRTPAFPVLVKEYPEIVGGSRFDVDRHKVWYKDQAFASSVHYVDTSFATTFSFPVLSGDMVTALHTPNHLVLTEEVVKKFFGDHKYAVGKKLEIEEGEQIVRFTVGAVVKDPPANSSLQFEILIPWLNPSIGYDLGRQNDWYSTNMITYVQLRNDVDPDQFVNQLASFKEKYFAKHSGAETEVFLLPLAQVRSKDTKNQPLIVLLSVIAVLILVVAAVNFMNLSTAQSLVRIKEVGLRKAMGSRRVQLVSQFLIESTLVSLMALLGAVVIVYLALPWINNYFELALSFSFWGSPVSLLTLVSVGLAIGLLASWYPAVLVSGFRLTKSIRRNWSGSRSSQVFQKGLVVAQYACSILLIAGTIIIWRQTQFMKTQDLKFDQHNIVAIRVYGDRFEDAGKAKSRLKTLSQELEQKAAIESVAFSSTVPTKYWHSYDNFYLEESPEKPVLLRKTTVGDGYFSTYGINLVEGRSFSAEIDPIQKNRSLPSTAADTNVVIINQAAMKAFGWQDIQNKYLRRSCLKCNVYKVVGVTEDFHYQGLQEKIEPMAHLYRGSGTDYNFMSVRLNHEHVQSGLATLEEGWSDLGAIEEFDYFFLDEEFDLMYKEQERLATTATLFTLVAVVIAILGLLGLATFSIRQRRREVGVRKAMGASAWQVVVLLTRNFAWLVLLAFLAACPIIYFSAQQFLQTFAYHISVEPAIFLIAGVTALILAGISVSFRTLRTALSNPAKTLRLE